MLTFPLLAALATGAPPPPTVAVLADRIEAGTTDERREALRHVRDLGPKAAGVAPELAKLLENCPGDLVADALEAAAALGPAGKAVLPGVLVHLNTDLAAESEHLDRIRLAARTAGALGRPAHPKVIRALATIMHRESEVRRELEAALKADPAEGLPSLVEVVDPVRADRDLWAAVEHGFNAFLEDSPRRGRTAAVPERVRREAAGALAKLTAGGEYGAKIFGWAVALDPGRAGEVTERMAADLRTGNKRPEALLEFVAEGGEAAAAALVPLVVDPCQSVRDGAGTALYLPICHAGLFRGLNHPSAAVREKLVELLRAAEPYIKDRPARERLVAALVARTRDHDSRVRLAAARVIVWVSRAGGFTDEAWADARRALVAAAVPVLIDRLTAGPDQPTRYRAARALEELGPAAKPALPALRAAARRDKERSVRETAAAALKGLSK